ncbi:von Willebrand factor type A domain-containing protein [Niabella ginsengisoli]|uniref:von Willebrand factor type A domain-containing protein n=1 Tax=Niabella ginsengisoli TaxID=522298 RepID=A0ABS9SFV2_9BACT|nr:von Willebrand factor type A domain-containing protein [Niabella ginsengisoli]MCH5597238.1 von Willebrand factor type A domain-containing protein [Niabella ginsengisoli]
MKYIKILTASTLCIALLAFTIVKKSINGKIVDENNQPITAAIVQEKGTSNSATTGDNGNFSMDIENDKSVLVITAVGFQQQEIKVGAKTKMHIVLKNVNQNLEEVVVVGYGTQQKSAIVGSVANVAAFGKQKSQMTSVRAAVADHVRGLVAQHDSRRNNTNFSREGYDHIQENPFLKSKENPLSTFSIDVDGASYSNIRRFINNGQLPPAGAVRIEEMINYFTYNYPQPSNNEPFSINTEYTVCPWNEKHQLISIGLQGKKYQLKIYQLPISFF